MVVCLTEFESDFSEFEFEWWVPPNGSESIPNVGSQNDSEFEFEWRCPKRFRVRVPNEFNRILNEW